MPNSIITGTGCYIPTQKIANAFFLDHEFYGPDGTRLARPNAEIIAKFQEITGIQERRYVTDDLNTSDIACLAAERALEGVDRESLDGIIVAHNFGEIRAGVHRCDIVPSIAARVKHKLGIRNPYTVAYDLLFGCPGWLQGLIVADSSIRSGDARKVLVIGTETLSRVSDPHDIDHMIYSDGAGATLVGSHRKKCRNSVPCFPVRYPPGSVSVMVRPILSPRIPRRSAVPQDARSRGLQVCGQDRGGYGQKMSGQGRDFPYPR